MKRLPAIAVAVALAAVPSSLLAWGSSGHRIIGEVAIRALPKDLPAFLRTPQAARDVGELSREPDRSKGSGKLHDADRDPGHFIDLDDAGKVLGGPPMVPLAATRADYEAQLRAAGLDQWKAGYLPYSIVDRWQQLTTDLAYWRVLKAAEANPKWKANRAWFVQDRVRREALILKGIGELSHFVGDGSQPLHVTDHYNGWGDYPNPNGYTTARVHGPFESDLVRDTVTPQAVTAKLAPLHVSSDPIDQQVAAYLTTTSGYVIPFYEMEKAGGLAAGDPRGTQFAVERMAAGASELRDLIVEAWQASLDRSVGWKPVAVKDVIAGKVDPYPALYGID
ncbi:MAG: S1/P1 Nuclease [Phenylobacterium sp.]|uniref:S1/P1 Nuclease n=1 Tax=Phenylobacterium sp. TaxID=1871053 RepID=UPI0025F298E8|nr:S1/P1 Nuclease [Phenylobacterium sp.]MBI1196680.1 S1/P1 Nuclease [Phenylobacterium sp.]